MNDDLDYSEFAAEALVEVAEHVGALNTQLLVLERNPADPAPIRQMLLCTHTVKGCTAMVGLIDISTLAHAMEDVLTYLRDEHQPLDSQTADLLFLALDVLRLLVEPSTPDASRAEQSVEGLAALLRERTKTSAATAPIPAIAVPASPPATARILLVEDSATVRLLETMLLSDAGFDVEAVSDGRQALTLALTQPFQLLVTGVETSGLRGPDLAATLRSTPAGRDLPIILMSSEEDALTRQSAADAGVQAYIRKGSFGRQRLVETARELLG